MKKVARVNVDTLVAMRTGTKVKSVRLVLDEFTEVVADFLAGGYSVTLERLGTLTPHIRQVRHQSRLVKGKFKKGVRGETKVVGPHTQLVVHFSKSPPLKAKMKEKQHGEASRRRER